MDTTWDAVRTRLSTELTALGERGFVIVGEAVEQPERRRWSLRRPDPAPARYVQAVRTGDWLLCECVGPPESGGTWAVDTGQEQVLRGLGLMHPDEVYARQEPFRATNWTAWKPRDEAGEAAALLVDALAVLHLSPAQATSWQHG